ncbi:hypothetical protein QQF64_033462 [Cirrhinus molitorella]|uniref:Uncharacterized protein n=1 Tax=Cirrhinus molitorella TaxID=172907 RepID=A0ABR3MTY6_9TELE
MWSHEKSTAFIRYITDTTFLALIQAPPYRCSHTHTHTQFLRLRLHECACAGRIEACTATLSTAMEFLSPRRTVTTAGWASDKGCIEKTGIHCHRGLCDNLMGPQMKKRS